MSNSQRGTAPAMGQDLGAGGWMGWEEVQESCCDLKQTLTPVRAQAVGFYQLFVKPSSGVSCFLDNFR